MKGTAILALAITLSAAGCTVDRRSDAYACRGNDECDASRTCDRGYCVPRFEACPSPCTSCDVQDKTCRIECSSGRPCGNVACPEGYDCTIRCTNANACGEITCGAGQDCDVACSGTNACGDIACGPKACEVTCTGTQACGAIDCATSCACVVKCNSAAGCMTSCPLSGAGERCTEDGLEGAPCDSTFGFTCDTCL